jgi:epoxyqueuosine reductase QueG
MIGRIRNILDGHLNPEIYEYGFSCLEGLLFPEYSAFTHGISLMRKLDDDIIDEIKSGPTRRYFDHYHAVNTELNETVGKISSDFSAAGIRNRPVKATVEDSDLDDRYRQTLEYSFSHKLAATRAGLGWIGKTDLLVSKRFGPRVRLASILTDMPLPVPAQTIDEALCGNCSICVDSCPAHAANGLSWDLTVHRNDFFDPFKCRDYCRLISKEKLDETISLCGKCVWVCPKGR